MVHTEIMARNFLTTILKNIVLSLVIMSNYIVKFLTCFVNFPVAVTLHEKPKITVKKSG